MKILEKVLLVKEMTHNWLLVRLYLLTKSYKIIAVDLSKQQALDADPKAIQQINFTANLDTPGHTRIYFILEEATESVFEFSQGTHKEV